LCSCWVLQVADQVFLFPVLTVFCNLFWWHVFLKIDFFLYNYTIYVLDWFLNYFFFKGPFLVSPQGPGIWTGPSAARSTNLRRRRCDRLISSRAAPRPSHTQRLLPYQPAEEALQICSQPRVPEPIRCKDSWCHQIARSCFTCSA
jgi:hypothetical protein